MKFRGSHLIAWIIVLLGLLALIDSVDANSRGGGMKKEGVITDVPDTVRAIEERADIRWSINTAEQWVEKDEQFCRAAVKLGSWGQAPSVAFVSCMHERLAARLLFMLRRDCTGLSAISEICGMEVK